MKKPLILKYNCRILYRPPKHTRILLPLKGEKSKRNNKKVSYSLTWDGCTEKALFLRPGRGAWVTELLIAAVNYFSFLGSLAHFFFFGRRRWGLGKHLVRLIPVGGGDSVCSVWGSVLGMPPMDKIHRTFPWKSIVLYNTNKNRLSSTTCGEELQKIGKDWQSLKDFVKKTQKSYQF